MDSDPTAVPSADVSAATFSFDAVEGFHASLLDAAPPTIRQRATRERWTTTALIAALQKAPAPSDSTGPCATYKARRGLAIACGGKGDPASLVLAV